jgi:hypothetical protein
MPYRRPDAQGELLSGLFAGNVLGRPWSQGPRRLLRRIGSAPWHVGSDRRLGPLARGLIGHLRCSSNWTGGCRRSTKQLEQKMWYGLGTMLRYAAPLSASDG